MLCFFTKAKLPFFQRKFLVPEIQWLIWPCSTCPIQQTHTTPDLRSRTRCSLNTLCFLRVFKFASVARWEKQIWIRTADNKEGAPFQNCLAFCRFIHSISSFKIDHTADVASWVVCIDCTLGCFILPNVRPGSVSSRVFHRVWAKAKTAIAKYAGFDWIFSHLNRKPKEMLEQFFCLLQLNIYTIL